MFSSQEIGSGSVSFQMIFEDLQSELVRFYFHLLRSKLQKIPEFNLSMEDRTSSEKQLENCCNRFGTVLIITLIINNFGVPVPTWTELETVSSSNLKVPCDIPGVSELFWKCDKMS